MLLDANLGGFLFACVVVDDLLCFLSDPGGFGGLGLGF